MITKRQLLRTYDTLFAEDYTPQISDNLDAVVEKVNQFLAKYTGPVLVNSGWRPAAVNSSTMGAAPKSNHMVGLAVDLSDVDGKIMAYVLNNLDLALKLGLYFEDWRWTKTWCHIQIIAPKSKKRIFRPSEALASAPQRWSGSYDSRFDK